MGPVFSHHSLRWRMDHTERMAPLATAVLLSSTIVLWLGWWTIALVMFAIGGRGLPDPWVEEVLQVAFFGALLAQIVVMGTVHSWNWTEIQADPHELVLRGPLRSRRWTWRQIRRITATSSALVMDTERGRLQLDRGSASPEQLRQVASWLENGRSQGAFDPMPARPPPVPVPPELERLRRR